MFDELLDVLGREVSAGLAFEELKAIHAIDRWFTFPAFAESAALAVSRWKEFGLSGAKAEMFPADGRTPTGSWIMPYAWDASDATLVIEEPSELAGTVLASYREIPCSLAMWSAPTPEGGILADLEWIEDAGDPEAWKERDARGKIVFTSARPVSAKGLAARAGAAGILSDFVTHRLEKPDCVFWTNAWSDDPGGWGLLERDSRIFGFGISPRRGEWLREALRRHGRVRVRAVVESRIYAGEMPTATAVIPGRKRSEEVLVLGHAFEQGANDNASGCAVMLEAARALSRLLREGKLARPRRSIRFLFVSECYTTFAYCERYRRRMAGTVAAACFDSVGHRQDLCGLLSLREPPDANASFVTAFAERLAEAVLPAPRPTYSWVTAPYNTTDNVVADPMIGPPTVLFMPYPDDLYWHSSGDTPDKIDVEALGRLTRYAAAYLYILASAGPVDALYFAALSTARAKSELSASMAAAIEGCRGGRVEFRGAADRLLYLGRRGAAEVDSVRRLVDAKGARSIEAELGAMSGEITAAARLDVEQLERVMRSCGHWSEGERQADSQRERAAGLIPERKYIGTMALDFLAPDKREGMADPRWHEGVTAALFWCDGKRTLAEVLEAAGNELRRELFDLVPVFEFLARHGLIELHRKG